MRSQILSRNSDGNYHPLRTQGIDVVRAFIDTKEVSGDGPVTLDTSKFLDRLRSSHPGMEPKDPNDFVNGHSHTIESLVYPPNPLTLGLKELLDEAEVIRLDHSSPYALMNDVRVESGDAGYLLTAKVSLLRYAAD